jgi:integrase
MISGAKTRFVWTFVSKGQNMSLKVAEIQKLEPRDRRYTVFDGHGLGLEVMQSGLKVWRTHYRLANTHGVATLGRFPQLSLINARKRHSALMAGVRDGISPTEQHRAEKLAKERDETVKAFGEKYLTEYVQRRRRDIAPMRRYLERDVYPVIGNRAIGSIHTDDVRELIFKRVEEGKPQSALAIRNLLKRLWDYALVRGVADKNPLAAIPAKFVAEMSERNRALKPPELAAFLKALQMARIRPDLKAALCFILLTLTRKGEVRRARWDEFDLDAAKWALPEAHSKTDTALVILLSRQALKLLRTQRARHPHSSVVFPMHGSDYTPIAASTLNRALSRIHMNIEHFTVHDLRRTAATNLSEQEYNTDVIEKALNHKLKGVRGVYNRAQYATQRREMLQAWADWLDALQAQPMASEVARNSQSMAQQS